MKTRLLAAMTLVLAIAFDACNDKDDNQPTPGLSQTDKDYINQYTQLNLGQTMVTQLALDSGTSSNLSVYAQAGLQQYLSAQRSLDSLAQTFNLVLPTDPDTASANYKNTLMTTARGKAFDSVYAANQLIALDNYIIALNNGTTQVANSRLKTYIQQQLPLVQQQRTQTDSLRLAL